MRKKLFCFIAIFLCLLFAFSACAPKMPTGDVTDPSIGSGGGNADDNHPDGDHSDGGDDQKDDDQDGNDDDKKDDSDDKGDESEIRILADDITIQAGTFFDPLKGVSASNGDLTPYISVSGNVDTSREGDYFLTYQVARDGKTATYVRKVTVANNPAIGYEPPVFLYEAEESYNIARGCHALSTSSLSAPANAFDGDNTTRWESVHGLDEVPLTVDLGAVVPIEEVSILWEAAYARSFDILVSTDGERYSVVHSETNFVYHGGTAAVYSVGEDARFVRILCHTRATSYGFSIYEFSVFGKKGTVVPAEKFPVLYDSDDAVISDEQTLTFDLGGVKSFDGMEISWKDGSPLSYTVSTSSDGNTYTDVTHSGNGFREGTLSARYVRLTMHTRRFYMSAYRISQTIFRMGGQELGGVTASGDGMDGHPTSAALRDWNTWWESIHDTAPQTIDLGSVKEVGRVDLTWNGDNGRQGKYYDLQTSTDGQTYTTAFRQTHGGLQEQSVYLYEAARYLRIVDYQNGDTPSRQGGTRFMLEGIRVNSQYPNEEKVDYDTTLSFPQLTVHEGKNGSYVSGDMTFPSAKLVTYLDDSLRDRPIPSNDWWQSLLINDKGHNLYLNPLVATFDDSGVFLTNPGDGYYSGGNPGNGSQTIDQDVHDLHIGYAGFGENTEVRVTGYSDYSISTVMTDDRAVDKLTSYFTQGALYGYFFFAEPDMATISSPNLLAVYDLAGNQISASTFTGDGIIVCVRTHSGYVGGTENGNNREYEERYYVVNAPGDTQFAFTDEGIRLNMTKGNFLSVGALSTVTTISASQAESRLPHGSPNLDEANLLHAHGYAFVIGTRCDYDFLEAENIVRTTFSVQTFALREGFSTEAYTAFMPHHYKNSEDDLSGSYSYAGVHGACRGHVGNSYTVEERFFGIVPSFVEPTDDGYSAATLLSLLNTLYENNGGDKAPKDSNLISGDPYWQGKNLHPMAMAVLAADQIGATDLRDKFLEKIRFVLTDWFTYTEGNEPNGAYFYYDEEWGTLYYKNSEFGAGVNLADHHFTYGYYNFAAGVLCAFDPAFAEEYGDMIELLLRDYMNPSRDDELFPFMRNYDVFAGHGWAGGYADNNAGNNQESAGEALNSWVGAYLYATAVGNEAYRRAAICGFTTELSAIKQYWFNYDGDSFAEFYPYGAIGQLYGATNFMGTFFNGEPLYAYGIHMLPVEEFVTSYALTDAERTSLRSVIESLKREQANWNVSEDHKTLYAWQHIFMPMIATYDPDEAISWYEETLARQGNIGNDNEQFNVYYILHALKSLGGRTTRYWAEGGKSATIYEKDGVFAALCWNPTDRPMEFVFRSEEGRVGSALVPAHSLVSCDPTEETTAFANYRSVDALCLGDFAASEHVTENGDALTLSSGIVTYLVTFGTGQKYRRLVLTGEGNFTLSIDGKNVPLSAEIDGFVSDALSLTFKHTVAISGSGSVRELRFEEISLKKLTNNGTLTASSENGGNKANLAMDENADTRWESVHGIDNVWLQIALSDPVALYQMKIVWEAASARDYRVLVSETGQEGSFVEIFEGSFTGGARTDTITPDSPVQAKYIRLEFSSRTTAYGYSIFEIELFGI